MKRTVKPEILDDLPEGDPEALASREDMQVLHRIWNSRELFIAYFTPRWKRGDRLLEIGSGEGLFLLRLRNEGRIPAWVHVTGLDVISRPAEWPDEWDWIQADLTTFDRYGEFDLLWGSLILHQFPNEVLAPLPAQWGGGHVRHILFLEPVRSRVAKILYPLTRLIGFNRVSLHDGQVSIEAGFCPGELATILPLSEAHFERRELVRIPGLLVHQIDRVGRSSVDVKMSRNRKPSAAERILIAGGGISGLTLGILLRKQGVPVTVHEASIYPRHRVCGEFLCGAPAGIWEDLGLESWIQNFPRHRETSWWNFEDQCLLRAALPEEAIGISRWSLDAKLAETFLECGGELVPNSRWPEPESDPLANHGTVWTTGRRRKESHWIGIKLHIKGPQLRSDLEIHLGDQGYLGLSPVEDGWINASGLFALGKISATGHKGLERLLHSLRQVKLDALADRLQGAEVREGSLCGTSHFQFSPPEEADMAFLSIGDHHQPIPPFTGHGMATGMRAAQLATEPLKDWSTGRLDWSSSQREIHHRLRKNLSTRHSWANHLHPWLLTPWRQKVVSSTLRFIPFSRVYALLR